MQTIWVLGDQVSLESTALAAADPADSVVLMIESKARGGALLYHQLKLVLVYSAMRHFARDLRERGWMVDYHLIDETPAFEEGLSRHVDKFRPNELVIAEPNSFAEVDAVEKLARKLRVLLRMTPATQFLLRREEFREWAGGQRRLL
ncbi:MAG: cryptochrome/photolyase family protein, partial [Chthoniobacterales bacterium]